eukprot:m.20430 g.20430  ORF g.20430 m.20430 type:complete len:350 (-) comp5568_c1_seq1:56-1105(-)
MLSFSGAARGAMAARRKRSREPQEGAVDRGLDGDESNGRRWDAHGGAAREHFDMGHWPPQSSPGLGIPTPRILQPPSASDSSAAPHWGFRAPDAHIVQPPAGKRPRMAFTRSGDNPSGYDGENLVDAAAAGSGPSWLSRARGSPSTDSASAEESWFTPRQRSAVLGSAGPGEAVVDPLSRCARAIREARLRQLERYQERKFAVLLSDASVARPDEAPAARAGRLPRMRLRLSPEEEAAANWRKRGAIEDTIPTDGEMDDVVRPCDGDGRGAPVQTRQGARRRLHPLHSSLAEASDVQSSVMDVGGEIQPMRMSEEADGHDGSQQDHTSLTLLLNQLHHERILRSPRRRP